MAQVAHRRLDPFKLFVEEKVVTPDMASRFLQNMVFQRPLNERLVNRLVSEIHGGRWRNNGETIKFGQSGMLLDGQHRLTALVRSGVGLPMMVAYNVPEEAFDTIDTGRSRSTSNILGMQGTKNASRTGTAVRVIIAYKRALKDGLSIANARALDITATEIRTYLANNPSVSNCVDICSKYHKIGSAGGLSAALFLFEKKDFTHSFLFFESIYSGENLRSGDPALAFRNWLLAVRGKMNSGIIAYHTLAVAIRAWNSLRSGKQVKLLRTFHEQQFNRVL